MLRTTTSLSAPIPSTQGVLPAPVRRDPIRVSWSNLIYRCLLAVWGVGLAHLLLREWWPAFWIVALGGLGAAVCYVGIRDQWIPAEATRVCRECRRSLPVTEFDPLENGACFDCVERGGGQ